MSNAMIQSCLIRASAGTGKTYRLSNQYISILLGGEKPGAILATTFTRKAAGEIRERIITRLLNAASSVDAANELSEALKTTYVGGSKPGDTGAADYYAILRDLIQVQDTLRVYTLDSFFGSIAKAFAPELGLPENWTIIDDSEEESMVGRAVSRILNDAVAKDEHETISLLLQLLHSNKVRSRVFSHLVKEFEQLFHVYRTSTPEAWRNTSVPQKPTFDAAETIRRLESIELPKTKKGEPDKRWVNVSTSTIQQILDSDWEKMLESGFIKPIREGTNTYFGKPIPEEFIRASESIIAHARYELLHRHYARTLVAFEFLRRFEEAYRTEQFETGGIRFYDIEESLSNSALTEEFEHIYYRLDSEISHLLLDEFQDTSAGQWNIIRPLADEITSRTQEGRTFFCVGDVKQAIYGWRGGVREIFDVLENRYQGLSLENMQRSFRSSKEVISFVNTIFLTIGENPALLEYRDAATRWSSSFIEHSTARDDLSGHVSIEAAPLAEDGEKQSDLVLEHAADLVRDTYKNHPGASIAVLVRTNSCIETFLELLRDETRQVPASQQGGIPLTSSPVVRLTIALLRFAEHPSDTLSHWQLRHSPLHIVLDAKKSREEQAALLRKAIAENGLGEQIAYWAHVLDANLDRFERAKLAQLSELAYAFSQNGGETLDDFIRAAEKKKVEDPSSNRVTIMTIHQAKGLEFDIVVLPELDKKFIDVTPNVVIARESATSPPSRVTRYPNKLLQSLDPELERMVDEYNQNVVQESLSLLYVALTRAVHALHLVVAPPKPDKTACSPAGIALAAIESLPAYKPESTRIYSSGSADWTSSRTEKQQKESPTRTLPQRFSLASRRVLDPLAESSPSDSDDSIAAVFELSNAKALRWGKTMHAMFECLEWLDDTPPGAKELEPAVRKETSGTTSPQPFLDAFYSIINQPLVRCRLERSNYSDWGADDLRVYRELPFCVRIKGELKSGRIDRLIVGIRAGKITAAEIIDYKTDVISEAEEETLDYKQALYEEQITIYREVASRFAKLPLEQISARLLFLSSDLEIVFS